MKRSVLLMFGLVSVLASGCGSNESSPVQPSTASDGAAGLDGGIDAVDAAASDQVAPDDVLESATVVPDAGEDGESPDAPDVALDVRDQLLAMPHVLSVRELSFPPPARRFEIDFEQPLDHDHPHLGSFVYTAVLIHKDFRAPTVLLTSGYELGDADRYLSFSSEPASLLDANEVFLGHRYYEGALPKSDPVDWSKLNIWQAANDSHEIVLSFKTSYGGPWVSTGWSKGGMTAIFHEYFYPDDIALVIPMSAPISFGLGDMRYPPHLAQIGTEACRAKVHDFIVEALSRLDEMVATFGNLTETQRTQAREGLRGSAIGYQWAYWQFAGLDSCQRIPSSGASADALVDALLNYSFPSPLSPKEADRYSYTYQAMTQLGSPQYYPPGHLDEMVSLGFLDPENKKRYENRYDYVDWPWGALPAFDPKPMKEVDEWLRSSASDMIAVYGEYDPWTAGKVTLSSANRSSVYVGPEANHGVLLSDLKWDEFETVRGRIEAFRTKPLPPHTMRSKKMINRALLLDLLKEGLL